jgi:3',5'-cyclic AMP phosphodiesterase CpdA
MALSDTGTPPGQKSKAFPSYSGFEGIDPTRNHFLVVSDTQKTSRLEFWRERNDRERRLIIDEMTRREPAFILHLGDLTARGSSKKHWDEFDDLNKILREKSIPCFPVLGNHELYGNDKVGLEYYYSHFPHLMNRRWYSFTWKNVGLILLDSNFSDLTPEQMDLQEKWYWGELERFNHDEKLDHIIVCCHHPPLYEQSGGGAQ